MAYNSFKKLSQLRDMFGVDSISAIWLPKQLQDVKASDILKQNLADARLEVLTTEKAKSEFVVAPILKELKRLHQHKFSTFSGFQFDVDKSRSLAGYCDFILSANPGRMEIDAPVFCLVEAKNAEIERGLAQCGAEMIAAQIFNTQQGNNTRKIFGCVTNAFSWCFIKLEDNTLFIDTDYVPLTFDHPEKVLAALHWVVAESLAKA